MVSASKPLALAQPFSIGDAIKTWFGLFNLFLEANQIVIAENLHALFFSDIATSRDLLKRPTPANYFFAFNYFGLSITCPWQRASQVRKRWTLFKLLNLPYH